MTFFGTVTERDLRTFLKSIVYNCRALQSLNNDSVVYNKLFIIMSSFRAFFEAFINVKSTMSVIFLNNQEFIK